MNIFLLNISRRKVLITYVICLFVVSKTSDIKCKQRVHAPSKVGIFHF